MLLFSAPRPVAAEPATTAVETIYILPGSHLDVGFTDTPSGVRESRIAFLDQAIDAAGKDPGFHWFEESGWVFDAWHDRHRNDPDRLTQARALLQGGRLGVGATWVNPLAAAMPEALGVLTLHLDELERDFGYRPAVAVMNDSPSHPEALVDALAANGVRFLLVGANMFVSQPLPAHLVRTPFWWQSAKGARVLTFVDPDSYHAAFSHWAIEPGCARVFEPGRFPAEKDDLATMARAIAARLESTDSAYDSLIVQHALDNWGPECAMRLPDAVRRWNASGRQPTLRLAPPEQYFHHIQERYGKDIPVYQGEWGGHWDAQRVAGAPISFWRLREAARGLSPAASRKTRVAMATVLDHNLGFGPPIMGFTKAQVRDNARETAEMIARAIRLSAGADGLKRLPQRMERPPAAPMPERWLEVLATDARPARIRAGPMFVGPFVHGDAPELAVPVRFGADDQHLVINTQLDRNAIPGTGVSSVYVVLEIPFRASRDQLRLAPEGSPSALAGRWLRAGPPNGIVVGPDGVRLIGHSREIRVSSPLVISWTLVAYRDQPGITWLQGLVLAQSELTRLKGGKEVVLPFEVLYPGEPSILNVDVALEWR